MGLEFSLILAATFLFSFALSFFFLKKVKKLFQQEFAVKVNYQGKKIALAGPVFFLAFFIAAGSGALFSFLLFYPLDYSVFYSSLFLLTILFLAGLLDDLFGSGETRGFKGHFSAFFKGKVTTGFLKAVVIFLASLIYSAFFSPSIWLLFLNAFLISLLANFLNLLDLRPGRAGKVFLFFSLFSLLAWYFSSLRTEIRSVWWLLWVSFLPPFVLILWYDLKERMMLGDGGSNLLGGFLGLSFSLVLTDGKAKLGIVILMVLLHLLAEFSSFSLFFEKFAFLRFFDNLGRLKERKLE